MEKVVHLSEVKSGIVQLTMEDRESKNTFSEALTEGLIESFEKIKEWESCKVVILTGYDSYFSSGGTQDALLALSQGQGAFTDKNLYSLALDCSVPVISAMQGHGIGGGFVMGLFADFVILSRESIYTTNFMKYGFTPGMGATYILPKKLGSALSQEMLLTAKNYRGEMLQKRGVPFPVLPRGEVLTHAMEIAENLNEKPKLSLITLKDHLVQDSREELQKYIEKEVLMHDKTFHQDIVKNNIKTIFGK